MAENIGLLYPIYLDISMMVSFVATIEGGYSLENVWKQSKDLSGDLSSEVEGEAGLPDILSTFVKASLKGSGSVEGKLARSEESQIVLRHTEASLFMRLRHELRRQGRIVSLDECEQEQWDLIQPSRPSDLVEISGEVHRSPINEMTQIIKRIMPFILQSLPQKEGIIDIDKLTSEQKKSLEMIPIVQALCADLESSPITDMLLKHEGKWKKSAVLDLSTKVLPLEEQELLRCGRVVVLGKATRVLTRNENINLYRRSILGYATQDLLIQMSSGFNGLQEMNAQLEPLKVEYPAIEIIPMAIYV